MKSKPQGLLITHFQIFYDLRFVFLGSPTIPVIPPTGSPAGASIPTAGEIGGVPAPNIPGVSAVPGTVPSPTGVPGKLKPFCVYGLKNFFHLQIRTLDCNFMLFSFR